MKLFKIIKRHSLLLLGFLAVSASAAAETEMRVATWLPPTHPQNAIVWPTWGKWIEEATEGRVKLKLEYGLGHPKTMFELVEDGVVDASYSYHGYVPGRFKLTLVVEQPLLGTDSAEAASVAYWRVYDKYFAKANEHEGLVLAGLFSHAPAQIQLADPISSLSDLKGKKIRIGGGVPGEIGKRMGITPVGAPAPKVYEMMQQGVVDGVFIPVSEQKILRLNEVARTVVSLPGGLNMGSFGIFISPDFMESLSSKDREAIMSVSGEKLSQMAGEAWDQGNDLGYQAAEEAGVNVVKVSASDPMAKEFQTLVKGMDEEWIESVHEIAPDARDALSELRSIARDYRK